MEEFDTLAKTTPISVITRIALITIGTHREMNMQHSVLQLTYLSSSTIINLIWSQLNFSANSFKFLLLNRELNGLSLSHTELDSILFTLGYLEIVQLTNCLA